jgi:hypothetical protein
MENAPLLAEPATSVNSKHQQHHEMKAQITRNKATGLTVPAYFENGLEPNFESEAACALVRVYAAELDRIASKCPPSKTTWRSKPWIQAPSMRESRNSRLSQPVRSCLMFGLVRTAPNQTECSGYL